MKMKRTLSLLLSVLLSVICPAAMAAEKAESTQIGTAAGDLLSDLGDKIRSGGKTFITFLTDSVYTTCVNLTLAFLLSRYTSLNVMLMYLLVQASDIPKVIIGMVLVRKRIWVNNLVGTEK